VTALLQFPRYETLESSSTPALTTGAWNTVGQSSTALSNNPNSYTRNTLARLTKTKTSKSLGRKTVKLSDEELILEITQKGRSDLFGQLYDRYSNKVYRKCMGFAKDHDIAQDMVQDVFIKVFDQLQKFQGKSRFSTWLYTITYNFCVEYYRRNSKHTFTDINNQPDEIDETEEERALLQTRSDKLKKALKKISADDREILVMKYRDQVPIREIMDALNISESAVKMRLARARLRAKEVIDQMAD
jgi:RNA polymerase sigma-70 factor (ECF subfamily)